MAAAAHAGPGLRPIRAAVPVRSPTGRPRQGPALWQPRLGPARRVVPARLRAAGRGGCLPWESAATGAETNSHGKTGQWGEYEQHITGDIALAARQYWYTTGDAGGCATSDSRSQRQRGLLRRAPLACRQRHGVRHRAGDGPGRVRLPRRQQRLHQRRGADRAALRGGGGRRARREWRGVRRVRGQGRRPAHRGGRHRADAPGPIGRVPPRVPRLPEEPARRR